MSDTEKTDLSALMGGISEEQLQSAVQSIAANPAFGKLLGELQGKSDGAPMQIPPITPDMMAKLPQMMAALGPLAGGGKEKPSSASGADKASLHDAEKRKKLLAALKPYLSGNRRDAVDSIARMTELTDILSALKLPPSSD